MGKWPWKIKHTKSNVITLKLFFFSLFVLEHPPPHTNIRTNICSGQLCPIVQRLVRFHLIVLICWTGVFQRDDPVSITAPTRQCPTVVPQIITATISRRRISIVPITVIYRINNNIVHTIQRYQVTDVSRRVYHLHFKRPRWWTRRSRTVIHVSVTITKGKRIGAIQGNFIIFLPWDCWGLLMKMFYFWRCDIHQQQPTPSNQQQHQYNPQVISNGLQYHPSRSRSVPEGLAQGCECNWNRYRWQSSTMCKNMRPIQVVEQITTSVWPIMLVLYKSMCLNEHLNLILKIC